MVLSMRIGVSISPQLAMRHAHLSSTEFPDTRYCQTELRIVYTEPSLMKLVLVNDLMQTDYRYELTAPIGRQFDPEFLPELTPKQMLALGVFGGKYMTDCQGEFPQSWWRQAKLSPAGRNKSLNFFGAVAGSSLSTWRRNGWIHPDDPRGWFQWYCRYYMGRRMPEEDRRQVIRWKAFRRHLAQLKQHCSPGDVFCRRRQRQALLQWAYDSRNI